MPEQTDPVRETGHLAGVIHELLTELVNSGMNRIRDYASGAELRSAYLEEARALGYEEDAPELILVRDSDGAFFEADVDVTVRRLESPAAATEARQEA